MRKILNNILSALPVCGVILAAGCSEVIDWEVEDNEARLVVEGNVTDEYKKHYVHLSSTQNLYEEGRLGVSYASLTISDGERSYLLEEDSVRKGLYETVEPFAGEPGKTYRLDIQLQEAIGGTQSFEANAFMPHPLAFDSLRVVKETLFGEEAYSIKIFGENPKNTVDYYVSYVYKNDSLLTNNLSDVILFDDESIEGFTFEDFTIYSNEEIRGGDVIRLETRSVVRGYYEYFSNLMGSQSSGDPFGLSGPPANVYGNLSAEALGYFYAASVSNLKGTAED